MKIAMTLGACAALLVLAGCGTNDSPGTPGAESSLVGDDVGTRTGSPGGGGTSPGGGGDPSAPDSPVTGGEQGSASLPSLPIGGSVSFESEGTPVCGFLAWNGGDIPDGAAIRIDSLSLPSGVSEDSGAGCDDPPCLGAVSFTSDQQTCTVGLAWDGTPASDDDASISASGSVTCEEQSVCDQVQESAASGGGVASVQIPEVEESESSESESESEPESESESETESEESEQESEESEQSEPAEPAESESSEPAESEPTDESS